MKAYFQLIISVGFILLVCFLFAKNLESFAWGVIVLAVFSMMEGESGPVVSAVAFQDAFDRWNDIGFSGGYKGCGFGDA